VARSRRSRLLDTSGRTGVRADSTIEVVDDQETVLAACRFGTDKAGYAAMRKHVAAYRERVWAVEGSAGAGRRCDAPQSSATDLPSRSPGAMLTKANLAGDQGAVRMRQGMEMARAQAISHS
jgi:hypothetical protein